MLPTPSSLSSHIRPPCSSTIRRVRVSPRPVPSELDADRVPCWKESKIRDRSASAIPMPVSVTVIEHLRPLRPGAHGDAAPFRGELDGVADQVEQHLLEPQLVGA